MTSNFRLTFAWHAPSIHFGPATVAAFGGGASARKTMAVREPVRDLHEDVAKDRNDRNDKERAKAVEMAFGQIEKQFGKGSIMRLGQHNMDSVIPSISTCLLYTSDAADE